GSRWPGRREPRPVVVASRELEPIARLGEEPGLLAESAESIECTRLEPVADQALECTLQGLLLVPECPGVVEMAAAPFRIAATDQQPAETVVRLVISGIGRHGLPQALHRLGIPSPRLIQPTPQHPPARRIGRPAGRCAED